MWPIKMIPAVTMPMNTDKSRHRTTRFSIIIDGKDNAVTAIINVNAVPRPTPFSTKASAMGNVPKMSAYIGTPAMVATKTDHHLSCPSSAEMNSSGIQLWMAAPMPTPIKTYGQTRVAISFTCSPEYAEYVRVENSFAHRRW